MLKIVALVFLLTFVAGFIPQARADASRNPAGIPEQIQEANEIKEARQPLAGLDSLFAPWYRMKQQPSEEYGFNFSIAYTPLYQVASESLAGRSNQASGGIFETLATWDLFDRGGEYPGRLGFRIENRHRLWSDVVPQSLSGEIGAGVPTGIGFGEFDFSLAELWWEQEFVKDRFSVRAGKQLPFGYFDFFPFKNPKTSFTNAAIALNPTIAWPQFGLGISTEIRPREDIYILAGLQDANGNPMRSGFETFFEDREYFTIAEIGWDPGYLENGNKNPLAPDYHATIWHADARTALGRPEGWGAGFTATQPFGNLVAFGRYGYSNGGAALLKHLFMGGHRLQRGLRLGAGLAGARFRCRQAVGGRTRNAIHRRILQQDADHQAAVADSWYSADSKSFFESGARPACRLGTARTHNLVEAGNAGTVYLLSRS